jgi:penicillin-binding protein 1A
MREEKYISPAEERSARARPLGLRLHREPPSVAPHFLEEIRKHLEREYGSQRIYQGGLRVHSTLDVERQRVAVRVLRDAILRLDRRARGWVPPRESVRVEGRMPERIHLEEWDAPVAVGDVVRGVVLAAEPALAVVQIGPYRARVTPAEIAWTGRRNVSEVLSEGTVAPFRIQALREGEVREARVLLEQEPELQGSLLALEPRTGAVVAMVGGYDFGRSKFNRATQAYRQVGSAFKPIVYAAAIEKAGYTPATVVVDSPVTFPDNRGAWSPHNYDHTFLGPIPVRRALEQSRNVPAIKTLQVVGVETGMEYARRLGLEGPLQPYLPLAIGAGEATLLEMTAAFASFANQGLRMKPYLITRITDREGNVIEENRPQARDALRADTAYLLTSLLRGVVERGTATRARSLGRPVAGKTGTTDDFTDGWFVGFEPGLAAGVWLGFDDKRKSLGRGQDGARTALPVWMEFWKAAMAGRPVEEVSVPANIVFAPVDGAGQSVPPGAPGARMEPFINGTEPRAAPAWVPVGPS